MRVARDEQALNDDAACPAGDASLLSPIAVGTTGDTLAVEATFDG